MGIQLAAQTAAFIYSLFVGAGLGLIYDVFRVTRVAVRTGKAVIFAEDVVFFGIAASVTFLFLMGASDGRVRFFLLVGEFIGSVLYYMTLGRVVIGAASFIIGIVKGFLSFILRCILLPIWRLIYLIVSFILRPAVFIGKKLKKTLQRLKISLKTRRILLYNHLVGVLQKKLHKQDSKREGAQNHGEGEEKGA